MKRLATIQLSLFLIIATGLVFFTIGCPKKSGGSKTVINHPDVKNFKLWRTVDNVPPGADPSVSDSLGGAGFEKIAESLGFITYVAKEDELKYYGDSRATTGGEMKLVTTRYPLSLRPAGYGQDANYVENQFMLQLCYEGLLSNHPITQELIPAMATHWKISEDKMTFTFRIDPNARFWTGDRVTASDYVATWKLLMDESILEPSQQQTYGKFHQPVALSPYILQVTSKTKNFRNILYFGGAMAALSAKEIGNMTGKEFIESYRDKMPIGSGEYIVLGKDLKNQQFYSYTRRDDYWRKDYPDGKFGGNFDKISYVVVRDNRTLEYEMFKKGEVDAFRHNAATTDKWIEDRYPALENNWCTKIRIFTQGPWGTQGYAFNMRKPPFNDVRVRRAFGYCLDRKSIISKFLFNEYEEANSHFDKTVFENPTNEKVEFNPEKAIKLLAEAGWSKKNSEGVLVKGGKQFEVDLAIVKEVERYVLPFQAELKKIGVKMNVSIEDQNSDWKKKMERKFLITRMNWTGLIVPNPETSYHSFLAMKNDNTNLAGVADKRIDDICAKYDTTFDKAGQIALIKETDRILDEIYPEVLEWHPKGIRWGVWSKFGIPEWGFQRTIQWGYADLAMMGTWWYDQNLANDMNAARKAKTKLDESKLNYPKAKGAMNEFLWDYWKDFKDK